MRRTPGALKPTKIAIVFFRHGFSRERVGTYPTVVMYYKVEYPEADRAAYFNTTKMTWDLLGIDFTTSV